MQNRPFVEEDQQCNDIISNITDGKSSSYPLYGNSNNSNLQTRDEINGIALYKHALIDIFSLNDCKWHNVKITQFNKTNNIIQYQGLFTNNMDIEGAIHYTKNWWKIAKYKSKNVENNDNIINTLFAIRYRSQNIHKQNVMIFGYLKTKRILSSNYSRRYFEIKHKNQFMFCYDNQSKNKYIFKLDLTKITIISSNPNGLDPLSFSVSTTKVNSNDIKKVYFKCKSFNDYIDWISVLHYFQKYPPQQDMEYNEKIFDGIIEKKGEHNKIYKKRYFVLRNDHLWYSNIEHKHELHEHKQIDLNHVKSIRIIDDNDKSYYKFHIIQPQRKWSLRVKSKQERKKWKFFIEQQCNKLQSKNKILMEGIMEKKGAIHTAWQQRYFIFKNKILYYCKIGNKNNPKKHKKIDLHNIEHIDHIPEKSQYVDNGINYFEFHLKQKDRIWKLRVQTEDDRMIWSDCLFQEWNALQLTLMRYKEILSGINLHENIGDYFISKKYTISNIIDDHIHVMRYHNNIDFIPRFELTDCNKDDCPSWNRFCSIQKDRLLGDDDDINKRYFNIHDEENCLQNIFDNIHCYIYHTIDRRLRHHPLGRNKNNRDRRRANDKIKIFSASEDFDETECEEDDEYDSNSQSNDGGMEPIKESDDEKDISDQEEQKYPEVDEDKDEKNPYDDEYGSDNNDEQDQKNLISHNHVRRRSSMYDHAKEISFHPTFDGKYEQYNKEKYLYNNQPFPGEYECGLQVSYYNFSPGHECLKQEVTHWVNEERFMAYLEVCKQTLQTNHASEHTSSANNDHYHMRFGHVIGIEHALCLYLYCADSSLCAELRSTYRSSGTNHKESNDKIRKKHYQRFYWFGRFLYEAVEFFGIANTPFIGKKDGEPKKLYFGVSKRVVFASTFGEFYQPTSTTAQQGIAETFAVDKDDPDKHGLIVQLSNQFDSASLGNITRVHWVPWISPFQNEDEHLLFGYNNTLLIQNIYIWNYSESKQAFGWRSLEFEMNALNYWCKISMGHAGKKGYNIRFNNKNLKFKKTQRFLARLIEYELDYFVTIDASKSFNGDGNNKDLRYIYDFGDNTGKLNTKDSTVQHQYVEPGVYEVTVTAVDKNGNYSSTAKLSQRIFNPSKHIFQEDEKKRDYNAPYACLSCTGGQVVKLNQEIEFDASKSHDMKEGHCNKYIFDFGDGSDKQETQQPKIKYKYSESAIYCVSVQVFDANGLSSMAELSLRVGNNIKTNKPSIMISSYPTNCHPKAAMKWIPSDGFRYIQQLFHHILITKTGYKQQESKPPDTLEVDFRQIGKEKLIKRVGKYILQNEQDDAKKWKIAAWKIGQLYPNCVQFVNENGEMYQRKSVQSNNWLIQKKKQK